MLLAQHIGAFVPMGPKDRKKFQNKDGTLTKYALACGYCEAYSGGVTICSQFGVYTVRQVYPGYRTRQWSPETLKAARALAREWSKDAQH